MPIRSLSKLRYVNEEWRTMIYGMRKSIGKIVDAKIHSNEVKQVSAKTYNLNSYGLKVEAITPDYVLVKTNEASLTDSKAYVYQVKQDRKYELDYLSSDLVKESTDNIDCCMNNNLVALSFLYHNTKVRKNFSQVKMWSLTTKRKILEEEFKSFNQIFTDSNMKKNMVIVYHEKLEVIEFEENDHDQPPTFFRYSVNSQHDVCRHGSFNFPYITAFETNLSRNIQEMFVWKINEETHQLENEVTR